MRKYIKGLSLLLAVVMLTGCGVTSAPPAGQDDDDQFASNTSVGYQEDGEIPSVENEPETWIEHPTVSGETETATPEVPEDIKVPLNAQYIRTGELASYEGEPKQPFRVVRSADELNAYYEEFKDIYYLGRNQDVYMDTTIGFLDACDRFDEAFWEGYDLVLLTAGAPSGSIRHEVINMVSTDGGNEWVINAREYCPSIYTCDIAFWYFLIEVPKGMIEETDTVKCSMTSDHGCEEISSVQYIQTNAWDCVQEGEEELRVLETADHLSAYLAEHPEFSDGFLAACEKYDADFWARSNLIILALREESGSVRHEAKYLFKNELYSEDCWYLKINRLESGREDTSTGDEAVWHLLIEVRKEYFDAENELKISYEEKIVEEIELYNVQYVRTDNGNVELGEPEVVVLRSQEDLDSYYQENKDQYALLWKDSYKGDSTNGFLNICTWNYPAHFWEWNDLVMIVLQEPDKWIRHEVEEIVFSEGIPQKYTITISKRTYRETDEPANWHILVAVPKGQVWGEEYVKLNWIEVCTEEK